MSSRGKRIVSMALEDETDQSYLEDNMINEALNFDIIFQSSSGNITENTSIEYTTTEHEIMTESAIYLEEIPDPAFLECEQLEVPEDLTQNNERITTKKLVPYSSSSSESGCESAIDESPNQDHRESSASSSSSSTSSETWKRKKRPSRKLKNKKKKAHGLQYKTYKGITKPPKVLLPNPCFGKKCKNSCNDFSLDERHALFDAFWAMGDGNLQKAYINGCVKIDYVKRKRTLEITSRRTFTYEQYLMKGNTQVKVCQQFFIATLGITQRIIRNAILGKIQAITDGRGKHNPRHSITASQKMFLEQFIKGLPAVPSHYCRGSTKKLYLPSDIKTFTNLYEMYSHQNTDKMSISSFKRIIKKEYNIGIHVPKKDKCIKCERYRHLPSNLKNGKEELDFLRHIEKKESAKKYFLEKQKDNHDSANLIASFDLQKVLTTPHGKSMLIGFSRKCACYNFTIYESVTANAFCYFWGEKDGRRGANEICSHLFDYLLHLDQKEEKTSVHLFCDNCPGQNKNRYMICMLAYFISISKSIRKLTITYLVSGHTYMPVESMHATIERKSKNLFIQAPSEWPTILRNARTKPKPYNVKVTNYSSIIDWKRITSQKRLKDAQGNDITISDVAEMIFDKDNTYVKIKTTYENQAHVDLLFPTKTVKNLPKAYHSELPINKKKYDNLIELCKAFTIDVQYHSEYYSLKGHNSVADTLPETDIEECNDETED
ncbi:unnamed protein product [Acanthoscelides obtectus]|uniref:DUF7869 domain-containing protein n=1 Tax=Acanthoscelides obtectus TaxID=200917 RepID=A0A9P0P3R8_ACAOB|nr:unnamed protein product [Acanthoscelides obtectus]CAK1633458.1 hypothetical protein AOBTE_LOCUS8151 [Acanthoscelides obtectus]